MIAAEARSLDPPIPTVPSRPQRAVGEAAVTFGPVTGASGSATRIRTLHQAGCLKLRFPRLPGPAAEAVLVNTAGGLAGGDRLRQRFTVEPAGALAVTTQACERVYRSIDGDATVETRIEVGARAAFAYLPQETILFDGGRLRRSLRVECQASSRLLLVEAAILGRHAMGETVASGRLRDRWRICRDGRLVFAEDLDIDIDIDADEAGLLAVPAALGPHRAFATVLWQNAAPGADLADVRAILARDGEGAGGASVVAGLGIARLAAPGGYALRRRLVPLLARLAQAGLPRVWSL